MLWSVGARAPASVRPATGDAGSRKADRTSRHRADKTTACGEGAASPRAALARDRAVLKQIAR